MSEVVQAHGEEGEVIMSYLGMSRVNDKVSRGLKVHLMAFCWKAPGGGGRLRQATAREEKEEEKKQEKKIRVEKI